VGYPTGGLYAFSIKQYDTKIDSKKRLTIRGTSYEYYHVKEYEDGHIELMPRVLVDPQFVSKNTLATMDTSIKNLKSGKVSEPIDFSRYMED